MSGLVVRPEGVDLDGETAEDCLIFLRPLRKGRRLLLLSVHEVGVLDRVHWYPTLVVSSLRWSRVEQSYGYARSVNRQASCGRSSMTDSGCNSGFKLLSQTASGTEKSIKFSFLVAKVHKSTPK
ncbi:hypothetical protein BaRGS_00011175 [Batillaria attramentaria]|uniref:Uncharacterized protein n=1 Tax=Batillaria attramentaria TaxID=370345 RepID=A0ABD0LDR9_9CAEN